MLSRAWSIIRPLSSVIGAVLGVGAVVTFLMVVGHFRGWFGQEMAAWVQAFGSIAAIGAAVWIGHAEARRHEASLHAQRTKDLADHAQEIADWRQAFTDALKATESARILAERPVDGIDGPRLIRLLRNTKGMLDTYLALPPPNPSLSFLLIAARTEVEAPMPALEAFQADKSETSAKRLRATLDRSLFQMNEMREEYEQGVL